MSLNPLSYLPVVGGLFNNSGQEIQDQGQNIVNAYQGINLPNFNKYNPQQYQVAAQYNPQMAKGTTVQGNPQLQGMQMNNLQKMAGLAQNGTDAQTQAGYQQARNIGNNIIQGGTGAALQNAEARGQGGTGQELMARMMANQEGSQNAQNAALQQAANSSNQRALYQQAFGNAASNLSNQQFQQNAANADILNRFNMYNTQAANNGQMWNAENSQNVSNMNTNTGNQAQQYNNGLLQQGYQDAIGRAGGMAEGYGTIAKGDAAQGAAAQSFGNGILGAGLSAYGMGMFGGGGGSSGSGSSGYGVPSSDSFQMPKPTNQQPYTL